jgi:hypothetical protein
METSSSNINESGTLKTEKVYYKDGKFWFLEGDEWPEEPNEKDSSGDQWKEVNARQHYKESLTSAIKQAIQFDDQELAMKLVYGKHGHLDNLPMNFYQWRDEYLKEGLYNISPQEVIILDAKVARIYSTGDLHKHMPLTGKVARLVPSSLEKQDKKEDWKMIFEIIEKQYAPEQLDSMVTASKLVVEHFKKFSLYDETTPTTASDRTEPLPNKQETSFKEDQEEVRAINKEIEKLLIEEGNIDKVIRILHQKFTITRNTSTIK